MLLENTVKIATATRSREIFLVVGNTGFFSPQLLCSSRLFEADPSPGLWPAAVWLKRTESNFSRCAATHPPLTRSPLPCEQGRVNVFGEAAGPQCFTQLPDVRDHSAPVISSGGIMLLEDTVKTATASMSREIFLGRGNTGLFNAFSCFAAPASSRRIHPLPFGLPPFGLKE